MRFGKHQERIIYFDVFKNKYFMIYGFTKTSDKIQKRSINKAVHIKKRIERKLQNGERYIIRQYHQK